MSVLRDKLRGLRDQIRFVKSRVGRPDQITHVPTRFYGGSDYHSFVGYYDVQPFNLSQDRLLAGRCKSSHFGRAMDVPLEIGQFDLATGAFFHIDQTTSWCWQQGARCQYIQLDGRELILFNNLVDGHLKTVLRDPDTGKCIEQFPVPCYAYSHNRKQIAFLDFDTLQRCRPGYGYDWKSTGCSMDGMKVWLYDIDSGVTQDLFSTEAAKSFNPHPGMFAAGAQHYFNHLHFSPDGTRLMLFHLWSEKGKRRLRALVLSLDTGDVIDVTSGIHVSHYWWQSNDTFVFYGTDVDHGEGFHLYRASGGHIKQLKQNIPLGDGHPSFHKDDSNLMLSDSLINQYFERDIWLYDLKNGRRFDLGSFKSPLKFSGEKRCDLHPRWSPNGDLIAIDTAHAGYRQVGVLDVKSIVNTGLF